MDAAIRAVRPGMSECEIAGLIARETLSRGAQPIVNLVAVDERVRFRHPLPMAQRLTQYAMLVLCGRQQGLVASITRLGHWERLPEALARKAEAAARVDATFIHETRPGRLLGEILARAQSAYAESGFAEEWTLHHQGGAAGYEPREFLATLGSQDVVASGQAYAWNPSVGGTKSEDTILVGDTANEMLTAIDGWPMLSIELGEGHVIARPGILEIP